MLYLFVKTYGIGKVYNALKMKNKQTHNWTYNNHLLIIC